MLTWPTSQPCALLPAILVSPWQLLLRLSSWKLPSWWPSHSSWDRKSHLKPSCPAIGCSALCYQLEVMENNFHATLRQEMLHRNVSANVQTATRSLDAEISIWMHSAQNLPPTICLLVFTWCILFWVWGERTAITEGLLISSQRKNRNPRPPEANCNLCMVWLVHLYILWPKQVMWPSLK